MGSNKSYIKSSHFVAMWGGMSTNPTFRWSLPQAERGQDISPKTQPAFLADHPVTFLSVHSQLKGQTKSSQEALSVQMSDYTVIWSKLIKVVKPLCPSVCHIWLWWNKDKDLYQVSNYASIVGLFCNWNWFASQVGCHFNWVISVILMQPSTIPRVPHLPLDISVSHFALHCAFLHSRTYLHSF